MKKFIVSAAFLGSIFSVFIACNAKNQESGATLIDKEQIKKDIQAREDEFATVYNSGELKAIGYYADDAITYYQNRQPLVGKQQIMEFLQADLTNNSNNISFKTKEVFPSNDGNMVVEIGYFELRDSAEIIINTGNYMALFEKRNGKYVSIRDMSVSSVSLE
jgi:ketosteroid isomerase-like protein